MKIIVDTNVVFSAILSPSGKIGQILIYGRKQFEFYAPNLVKIEVKRHRDKIIQMGELTDADFGQNGTIKLQDDSDGLGAYIAKWEYSKPIPAGLKLGK